MRTTKVLSVTLPEAMLKQAKKRAKKENRTMSELVREALRRYEGTQVLRELQAYGQQRARELGIKEEDVDRLIHEDRARERQPARGSDEALERKAS
jgi:Arc/MetJ-type ribon-helix-helix transcriptional regulator